MDSNPSEIKARGGSLDLNSAAIPTATEQPETLTSPVDWGSGASGGGCGSDGSAMEDAASVDDASVVRERAKEVEVEHDAAGKKDSIGTGNEEVVEVAGGESVKGYSGAVDVGNVKVVVEEGAPAAETNLLDGKDTEEEGDSAIADVIEVKVAVEAGIQHEEIVVADEKLVDKGDAVSQDAGFNVGAEIGSGRDQAVKVGGRELTALQKRGRPRKLLGKRDVVSTEVGINVGSETYSGGDQDVLVGELESTARRKRGRPRRSVVQHIEYAGYHRPLQDERKDGFAGFDLVWGKVRSHPWWPGLIVDPSDASEMALNIQKDYHLVAYFGDRTFAWCDESRLKHFQTNFLQMEKQSSMDAFVTAVSAALQELSRRIELGMTCHCFMDETYASLKDQKVENAGIREGTCCSTFDKSCIISSFEPLKLIDYIQTLAQFPYGGVDRLELTITKSQLKAFYRSKGYAELPAFVLAEGLEDGIEGSPSKKRKSGEDVADPSTPTSSVAASGKGKLRVRGGSFGKKKLVLEHGRKKKSLSELMEKYSDRYDADGNTHRYGGKASSHSSHRKCKVADFGPADSGKGKKKKLDSLGDLITKSQTSSPKRQLKIGERMRQVAGQMTGSPPMLKPNGKTLMKSPTKVSHRKGDVGDALNQTKTSRVIKSVSEDYSSPVEMLAQLCLAARDPLEGYSFISSIASFFIDFRIWVFSSSSEDEKLTGTASGKKGRRKSTSGKSASLETSTSDYSQDSYWSDIVVSEEEELVSGGQKREVESQRKRQKKLQSADEPALSLPLNFMSDSGPHLQDGPTNPKNMKEMDGERCTGHNLQDGSTNPNSVQELEGERPTSNLQKEVDECMSTALVLTFNESDDIPAEADLIKIFGQYGPLREAETEVMKLENRAEVVFKRRSDAEVALHSARKYSFFGPALVSYRLRFLESASKASLSSTPLSK